MTGGRAPASVLLIHEFPGGFGGAERYLELLGAGLTAEGVDVAAIVFAVDGPSGDRLGDRLATAGVDAEVVVGRARPGPIARMVRHRRPELLHWNYVDPFAFRGSTFLLLPWGRPSVITDHLPDRRDGFAWEATRARINPRVPVVIVVGEQSRQAALEHWPRRPPNVRVVRNGVPVQEVEPPSSLAVDEPIRLLFMARLAEQKDPLFAVDVAEGAVAAGMPTLLRLVGEGPLAEAVARRGTAAHGLVEVAGFSPHPSQELARAHVLLAPSRYEGLPFTPLEALASGVPALLSDIAPHRELALDASAVRTLPADVDAWVAALRDLRADLPAASAAAVRVAGMFSLEAMVAGTVGAYETALG